MHFVQQLLRTDCMTAVFVVIFMLISHLRFKHNVLYILITYMNWFLIQS